MESLPSVDDEQSQSQSTDVSARGVTYMVHPSVDVGSSIS